MRNRMNMRLAFAGLLALNVVAAAQDRRAEEVPQPPPREALRQGRGTGEVKITLRPVGEGRFEVYVDGERVEGRAGERILRALQDRPFEPRRPGGDDPASPERPMRRGMQGEGSPPGAMGMDRPVSDAMPPLRQGVGQVYTGQVPELTDELLAEVLAVIADFDEVLHVRLTGAMATNPEGARTRLQNDLRRWMAAVELKRSDPELYELNVKDRRLAHETTRLAGECLAARRAGDAEKVESIRASIETLVGEHFDVRQKMRERDLAQLEQRLEILRTQVQQRRERRQEVIRQHLQQLFSDPAGDF